STGASTRAPRRSPSRRAPTPRPGNPSGGILSDYGSAQPFSQPCGSTNYNLSQLWPMNFPQSVAHSRSSYWCNSPGSWLDVAFYGGVIVRTPYRLTRSATASLPAAGEIMSGYPLAVKPGQVTDGFSNTMVISEKLVRNDLYEGGGVSDDRGWADGWDPDTVRFTGNPPISDNNTDICRSSNRQIEWTCIGEGSVAPVMFFGSAHPSGINAVFADASCRQISFEVDFVVFNALGTRDGEETFDLNQL
ncbi:MAG TPA: DUF1559 domain-containing protein, partial [Lacipirellulaceae bacterium]|nr:DUF1559 domain-containing protein [Lacipirellulaceae bacterium]